MKHPIDLEHWNRKEHFLFFGSMDDPFFGLILRTVLVQKAANVLTLIYRFHVRPVGLYDLPLVVGVASVNLGAVPFYYLVG